MTVSAFLGGARREGSHAWHDATRYGWLSSALARCITLVVVITDPLAEDARRYAALHGADRVVRLVAAPSDGDQSIISPRTGEAQTTVREALSVGKPYSAGAGGQSEGALNEF